MAIDDNTLYGLTGAQVKELPGKINAVKGKARELTTADYNWNSVAGDSTTTPFDSVAIGLLDDGVYTCKDNVNIAIHPSPNFPTFTTIPIIIVSKDSTSVSVPNRRKVIYLRDDKLYVGTANFMDGTGSDYHYLLDQYSLTNSLTSSSTTTALTANQGKTLKDLIDSLVVKGTGAPTTSTVGTVGKLYEDTTNGDLYICTDATNPYVWEEVGSGGGGPTVVQTTGNSTTDVMSQNAVTKTLFQNNDANRIKIGSNASTSTRGTSVGASAQTSGERAVAIGDSALASGISSVAVGRGSQATTQGQFDIGDRNGDLGYNNSAYRLLSGVYDGQSAHDAATKGQLDSIAIQNAGAPTTATVGTVGQLLEDTTNGKLYICTDTTGGTYTWVEVGAGGGGGSGITVLTAADYNYPSNSPDGVNPLALSSGIYKTTKSIEVYINRDAGRHPVRSTAYGEMYFVVDNDPQTASRAMVFYPVGADLTDSNGEEAIRMLIGNSLGTLITVEHSVLTSQHVVNNLTSTDTLYPLSANQGKVINDKITPSSGASAPTASTVGELGKIYIDSSTDNAYMCTKVDGSTYTWKQITA